MKMRPLPWVGMASTYSQQKGTKQTIILSNSCQIRALSQGSPIDSSGRVRGQACLCELTRPADGRMADHSLRCVPPLLYPAVSCALIPIIVRTAAGCEMTAGLEPLVCSSRFLWTALCEAAASRHQETEMAVLRCEEERVQTTDRHDEGRGDGC